MGKVQHAQGKQNPAHRRAERRGETGGGARAYELPLRGVRPEVQKKVLEAGFFLVENTVGVTDRADLVVFVARVGVDVVVAVVVPDPPVASRA